MAQEPIYVPTLKEQGYVPVRYFVAFMTFLGMLFNYMLRVNMNFAIIAMVKTTGNITYGTECHFDDDDDDHGDEYNGKFEWDEWIQSLINSSFFWGYIVTQIPGGRLAEKIGAKYVFGGAVTTAAVITFFIPTVANIHYGALIALRVLLGVSEGASFPSTSALLSIWAPPAERSKLATIVYAGSQAGTIVAYPLSAFIIDEIGWEAVFYIQGGLTLIWSMLWFFFVSNYPETTSWISEAEKTYIKSSIGDMKKKKSPPVPWKEVIKSPVVYAILITHLGNNWGFYTLLTDLPLYMKTMMKQDIKSNALVSGLPYLGMWIFSLLCSGVIDFIIAKKYLSIGNARKLANSISQMGPALCFILLCLPICECNRTASITLLFIAVALQGGIYSGFMVNHVDIAPNYAGTLFGITNAAATIPSWVAPLTVGALTTGQQTNEQWRKVFGIAATLYLVTSTFYVIFGSGEEQPWNKSKKEEVDNSTSNTIISTINTNKKISPSMDSNYSNYVQSTSQKMYYDNLNYVAEKEN